MEHLIASDDPDGLIIYRRERTALSVSTIECCLDLSSEGTFA
jgi:hypothetical protein